MSEKPWDLSELTKTRVFFSGYKLRLLQPDDANTLFVLTDENRVYLAKYLPWVDHVKQLEDTLNFINDIDQKTQNAENLIFAICNDETIIGTIGFVKIDLISNEGAIGYWISQEYQGKGIVSAACQCIIDIGFNEIGLNKVFIRCLKNNLKSQAVAIRLGFDKLTEPFDNKLIKDDNYTFVFCLLKKQ